MGAANSRVHILNAAGDVIEFTGLAALDWDYIGATYDGSNNPTQLLYKKGGSSGTLVATIDCTYDASNNLITRLITIA